MGWADMARWDVSAFTGIGWHWPAEVMRPLGEALQRVVDEVPPELDKREVPIIEKITFGGTLTVTDPGDRQGYKGRLFWARTGNLIYSKIRVKQGSVTVVPHDIESVAVSSEYPVYSVDSGVALAEYLNLVLRCSAFQKMLDGLSHGGSSKTRIHPEQFEALEIPLPPLATQRAIVERWQAARAAAEATQIAAETLDKEAFELLQRELGTASIAVRAKPKAFSLSWKEIERWGVDMCRKAKSKPSMPKYPTAKIRDICRMGSGGTPSRKNPAYFGGEIPWVKTTEVRNELICDTEEKITQTGLKNSAAKLYPAGSLIIAMYGQGATRGRTAKLGIEASTNQACCVLYGIDSRLETDFLWFYLMGEYDRLRELASGNNQPNLNAEMIANYDVPLPPLETQQALVAAITAARRRAADLRAEAERLRQEAAAEVEAAILAMPREPQEPASPTP